MTSDMENAGWRPGVWTKDGQTQTGIWCYNRSSDSFTIRLDSKDEVTGRDRVFSTSNDTPEWNGWRRVKEAPHA